MVMVKWKKIMLTLVLAMLVPGCEISKDGNINKIKSLVGDNEAFYKGGYGLVCDDLYIKRGDDNNNIYSSLKMVFNGNHRTSQQLVYIKNKVFSPSVAANLYNSQLPKDGTVILFTNDFFYILDLSSKCYFKYER